MADEKTLQALRAVDKADRMSPQDVFALLTHGRRDQSGAFTAGCGLTDSQAAVLLGVVFSAKQPKILARIKLIAALDDAVVGPGDRTAWDALLEAFDALPSPKDIACLLDDVLLVLLAAQKRALAA